MNVLYFGQAREYAGTKEERIALKNPANVKRLISAVLSAHPELVEIRQHLSTLVNGRMVAENAELRDGDRVALVPPVAGG